MFMKEHESRDPQQCVSKEVVGDDDGDTVVCRLTVVVLVVVVVVQGKIVAQGRLLLQDTFMVSDQDGGLLSRMKERRVFLFEQIVIFSELLDKKKGYSTLGYLFKNSVKVSQRSAQPPAQLLQAHWLL